MLKKIHSEDATSADNSVVANTKSVGSTRKILIFSTPARISSGNRYSAQVLSNQPHL